MENRIRVQSHSVLGACATRHRLRRRSSAGNRVCRSRRVRLARASCGRRNTSSCPRLPSCYVSTFRALAEYNKFDTVALDVCREGMLDKEPGGYRFTRRCE